MIKSILKIYEYLRTHAIVCWLSLCCITAVLAGLILRLDFKEDISAFLPLDEDNQKAMQVYQDVSGASKLLAIFQFTDSVNADLDEAVEAMGLFAEMVEEADSLHYLSDITTQIDLEKITELTDFVYANIPYFLTEEDYMRMDSLLSADNYIPTRLQEVKQMLMFPSSGLLASNFEKDPLNLFTPVVSQLNRGNNNTFYDTYEGYIFTKDMERGIVLMTSSSGNSETRNNAKLMQILNRVADTINTTYPSVNVHYIGGPAIAVGNASQIKKDSIISVIISVVLIMILLISVFKSLRNILLIVVSIVWGWLFALGSLSLVHGEISLIVVGISSIILGIAVNYPLHLIAHCNHTIGIRQALKEIISPLVIGNVTTVGAFIALVPLKANALRDLGLFSAFLLIGTILFVIIYLPHTVKDKRSNGEGNHKILNAISNLSLENKPYIVWAIVVLTLVFAWFSFDTKFDTNMSHINYMTKEQHHDMEYFQQMTSGTSVSQQTIYVVSEDSTMDLALEKNSKIHQQLARLAAETEDASLSSCARFFVSQNEQTERLKQWNSFVERHREQLTTTFLSLAAAEGFSNNAFEAFENTIAGTYQPQPYEYFNPLYTVFQANFSINEKEHAFRVVENLFVEDDALETAKEKIQQMSDGHLVFDIQSMNSSLANTLSSDFNYIGWACGLIVFLFLWFSFGNIELALLSFLPMAVSWIWILGIMGLTGIQFNIVNIILATFIFGQGDDYTIFMTEGCCFEYAYRRKMVASYKSSIIVSAMIMFIGIGTLILAKHPALHSLAELTIVGMFSVVLMAYVLPPLVFKWLVSNKQGYRLRPLTIMPMLRTAMLCLLSVVEALVGGVIGLILYLVCPKKDTRDLAKRRMKHAAIRLNLFLMPGVKLKVHNPHKEESTQPNIWICSQQSPWNPFILQALHDRLLIVDCQDAEKSRFYKMICRGLGVYFVQDPRNEKDMDYVKAHIQRGFSIAVLTNDSQQVSSLAEKVGLGILPIVLHGVDNVVSMANGVIYKGEINVHIDQQVSHKEPLDDYLKERNHQLQTTYETAAYFLPLIRDCYRYRGVEVKSAVNANLKQHANYAGLIDQQIVAKTIYIANCGYGEMPLLMGLVHPDKMVIASDTDPDKLTIARYAAEGLVTNLTYVDGFENVDNNSIQYDLKEK